MTSCSDSEMGRCFSYILFFIFKHERYVCPKKKIIFRKLSTFRYLNDGNLVDLWKNDCID